MVIPALTILYEGLLLVPGGLLCQMARYVEDVQAVYDRKSAIIASLSGFMDRYFEGLPQVSRNGMVFGAAIVLQ